MEENIGGDIYLKEFVFAYEQLDEKYGIKFNGLTD